jgi:hypothetical protein
MNDNGIRISYVRATFAAGLLAGCRSSLLKVTDPLESERELAHIARRRSGEHSPKPGPVDKSKLVAAALYAEWISDALHRQIAFYFELDNRLAENFGRSELPPTGPPPQAPPEWPQPPLPEPLDRIPNPLAQIPSPSALPPPRVRIAAEMQEIGEDLDDAIKAINWARNVRFQTEISGAAKNLREWVALSESFIAEDGRSWWVCRSPADRD